jgi:hypothetical protein
MPDGFDLSAGMPPPRKGRDAAQEHGARVLQRSWGALADRPQRFSGNLRERRHRRTMRQGRACRLGAPDSGDALTGVVPALRMFGWTAATLSEGAAIAKGGSRTGTSPG